MRKNDQTLTKTEFQVMSILWDLGHASCAWDILDKWEEPKPAYTTVATYLKVLHEKGFVDFFKNKGEGKTHQYVAVVTRAEYTRKAMLEMKKDFFGGSLKKMLNFFVQEEKLTAEDIQELLNEMEED